MQSISESHELIFMIFFGGVGRSPRTNQLDFVAILDTFLIQEFFY